MSNVSIHNLNFEQIIHRWLNFDTDLPETFTKNSYYFDKDSVFCNDSNDELIRRIVHKGNRKYLLSKFNKISSFGNGYSWYNIKQFLPNANYHIYQNIPRYDKLDLSTATFQTIWQLIQWGIEEIKESTGLFTQIAYAKEHANNNRILASSYDPETFNYSGLEEDIFHIKGLMDIIKVIPIPFDISFEKNRGWSRTGEYVTFFRDQSFTIEEITLRKSKLFFTDQELDTLALKRFIGSYGVCYRLTTPGHKTTYMKSLAEFKELWKDKDKVQEFREKQIDTKRKIDLAKEKKRLEEQKERIKKALDCIENFRQNGKNVGYTDLAIIRSLGYTLFHYNKEKNTIVSSLNMTIDVEEAKKGIKLFRLRSNKTELIQKFRYSGIIEITVPLYNEETDELTSEVQEGIQVGCHRVPKKEIEDFLKYYNLEW